MTKKFLTILMAIVAINAFAKEDPKPAAEPTKKKNAIEEKTKSCRKFEGLFTLYQDTVTGSMYMLLTKSHLSKEYIYFAYCENGLVETGHNRGSFRDNRVFSLRKYFDRVEFISKNTNFYFDPANNLSKAAEANVADAVLLSLKPIAKDSLKDEWLLDAGSIYMGENLHQVKPSMLPSPFAAFFFSLGSLNKEKCKYVNIRNYPANTDVVVDYVYDNPSPINAGGNAVADARAVSVRIQHTLIEMPQNDFKSRRDDARIGYFMTDVEDMTSTSPTPYKDIIHRWNLVKKDKGAALSEPLEPITWWIEKTTPAEFRTIIKEAGQTWNLAFEKAGFKNAVKIEEQPEDATWDAGDIRYNVLRWTSSPNPPFGGYGPSFVNPRTGQILGADIMLEYIFVTNRLKQEQLFNRAGLELYENGEDSHLPASNPQLQQNLCSITNTMQHNMILGNIAMQAAGMGEAQVKEYIRQSLYYLVLHEMGHTMGLNHNMRGSQMLPPDQLNNKAVTDKLGLAGSVMDYPAVNLSLDKDKQGLFFTTRPGPYDDWAIEYGYSEGVDDPKKEESRLTKILERSSDTLLIFGNDADDMRSAWSGCDPRVNVNDMSKDVLQYSADRFKLVGRLMSGLKEKYNKSGQSWQEMRQAYMILTGEMMSAATVSSRYIGGVYTNRAFIGQAGAGRPYTAVPLADQRKAMNLLAKNLFAVNAFPANEELYSYLQLQRRGFNFFGNGEDPKLHDRILMIQGSVLDFLLSPRLLKRMTDSRMYGNKYSVTDMMGDLTAAIFKDDLAGNVNTIRQNLQIEYVTNLVDVSKSMWHDNISKSNATMQLKGILAMLTAPTLAIDKETQSHRSYIQLKIKQSFEK
ncbi:MAG: DUF5117 domain-containing protein [Flavobacteriaceae bacterium]|nr:DUF5117 domain-containing protein [Flavobacteriaceae bacterium]